MENCQNELKVIGHLSRCHLTAMDADMQALLLHGVLLIFKPFNNLKESHGLGPISGP